MTSPAGPLTEPINRFLKHKRGLGYSYRDEERLLWILDRVAVEAGATEPLIDESLVRLFVAAAPCGSRSHYLSVVRQLALHLAVEEPRTFVPPGRFLNAKRNQTIIRVLSREEAARFLDACDRIGGSPRFPLRQLCHGTLLRVLLLTGLRRGEALALRVSDVDLASAIIHVRCGKFGKSRFVPVAAELGARLRTYDSELRAKLPERCDDDAFFPGLDGHSAGKPGTLYHTFRMVLDRASIPHRGRGEGPRLHDLRHTVAVRALESCPESRSEINKHMLALSTYLGHSKLESTYWYLHATPQLMADIADACEAWLGDAP